MRYQCFAYVRALFLAVICGALIPPFAFRFTVGRRRVFSPGFNPVLAAPVFLVFVLLRLV